MINPKRIISIIMVITLMAGMVSGIMFVRNQKNVQAEDGEMIEVSVKKVWDDYGDFDNLRPESIRVALKRGNEILTIVTLSDANDWYYKYEMPVARYDSNDEEISYTWECSDVDGYTRYVDRLDQMTIITDCHTASDSTPGTVILKRMDEESEQVADCRLRLKDSEDNVLITWISGDEGSIELNEQSLSASINVDGSLSVSGLEEGEYVYEEEMPKNGYTTAHTKRFKVEEGSHSFTYHWYTSLETALSDANNLNTANADCYRNDVNCEAGLFITDNEACLIVTKNINDMNDISLTRNGVIDLNNHTVVLAETKKMIYTKSLKMMDGTLLFEPCNTGSDNFNCITGTGQEQELIIDNLNCEVTSTGTPETEDYGSTGKVSLLSSDNADITVNKSDFYLETESLYTSSSMLMFNNENAIANVTQTNIEMLHGNILTGIESRSIELNINNCNILVKPQLYTKGKYSGHISKCVSCGNDEGKLTVQNCDISAIGEPQVAAGGRTIALSLCVWLIFTADKDIDICDNVIHADDCAMKGVVQGNYTGNEGGDINITGNYIYNEISSLEEYPNASLIRITSSSAVGMARDNTKPADRAQFKNNQINIIYGYYDGSHTVTFYPGYKRVEVENNRMTAQSHGYMLGNETSGIIRNNTVLCEADDIGMTGIEIVNGQWTVEDNQVHIKGQGDNVAISNMGNTIVNSGTYYAQPYGPEGEENSAGNGIRTGGTMILNGSRDSLLVSGGNAGIQCTRRSTTVINGGTYKSPSHGGIYVTVGDTGNCEINGGLFYNDINEYNSTEEGRAILRDISPYGGAYFGAPPIKPEPFSGGSTTYSGDWTVHIQNAEIIGGTWGVCLKDSENYVPPTVYLTNCRLEGIYADIFLQKNGTRSENTYAYICEGTVLVHDGTGNAIVDQYLQKTNVPHVIDCR